MQGTRHVLRRQTPGWLEPFCIAAQSEAASDR